MNRLRTVCVVLICVLLTSIAQSSPPALKPGGIAEIDGILQRAIEQGTVPGVVAIVANKDQILYHAAYGLMDVGKKKPMTKDSIFRIASMTKPVTSVAIMMLVEEGKLRLDDPVSKYIPSFENRETVASFNPADSAYTTKKTAKPVIIRHLLTNTSGIAYTFANDESDKLQKKIGKPAEELPLLYDPGTKWTYSGSTKVLGQVIEKITGAGLDKFVSDRIFRPLDLQDTSYSVPATKVNRVVTIQRRVDGKLVETANPEKIESPVAGDGGLNSTTADYIRFLQMFLNDGKAGGTVLLKKDSIQTMTHNQIGHCAEAANDESCGLIGLSDRRRS